MLLMLLNSNLNLKSCEQATLRRNMAPDPRLDPATAQGRADAGQLQVGSRALFLGRAYFGCLATVLPDVSRGLSKQVTSFFFSEHVFYFISEQSASC